jgi:tRNA (guanine-N7-)-methyltransferase
LDNISQPRRIKSFGRVGGRPLSPIQSRLMSQELDKYKLGDIAQGFDPKSIDQTKAEIWFEIGFGGAEHLINQAKANPEVQFIGAEPFIEGVAKAMRAIDSENITNIRLIDNDARPILENLMDNCLDRVFILFPDPWPKSRHHKRRLINDDFLNLLARVMKKGAKIRFASDWENYAEETLACFVRNQNFEWTAQSQNDWNLAPSDHFTTRYQAKQLGDCAPIFLDFIRL